MSDEGTLIRGMHEDLTHLNARNHELLTEIDRLRSDPYRLPIEAVPEGWQLMSLIFAGGVCFATLEHDTEDRVVEGRHKDPRAAMMNAIEKIGK